MANRNCVSQTVEVSIERYNKLVTDEATLSNVKKIVDGRYEMKLDEIVNALKYMFKEPEGGC
ncbi:MAG: hypothetical protein F8N38_00610 [Hungatella sp.]|jgi:hypothetical protein|nr:hypothetical protein [Hungatella sp.]